MTMNRLLTVGAMRRVDETAIAGGVSGYGLMQSAGAAVAERARALTRAGGHILILCGPGNNGGDGFVAGRLLADEGFSVALRLMGDAAGLSGDAAIAANDWTKAGHVVDPVRSEDAFSGFDLIVDAVFGAGLSRDIAREARALIEAINASGAPVLAVDVPSGLDGDTGGVRGLAVSAMETVTFVALKPGHLLQPGRLLCGALHVADIGTGEAALAEGLAAAGPASFRNGPALWRAEFPRPGPDSHKYTRGHALVLSGAPFKTGAARLAARGALRVGAGLVTVVSPRAALAENAAHLTAIMLRACDGPDDLDDLLTDEHLDTVLLGPGLGVGEATRDLVAVAASAGRKLVLDADALTSFKGQAPLLGDHLAQGGSQAVLTPHEGEFGRLFANTKATKGQSKIERARLAASIVGGIVVLKGSDTVIAAPDGRAAINDHGSPYLGTAGSGDVLGGLIAGLLAQGMPPFEAACAGVWLHGDAGRRHGPGLIAEDIPEMMPEVIGALVGTQADGVSPRACRRDTATSAGSSVKDC